MSEFSLTSAARASLKNIARHTEREWGVKKRDMYLAALDKRFHALAKSPNQGKLRGDILEGLRSYLEGRHVIFYLPRDGFIVIVDVLHEKMDAPRLLR